MTMLGRVYRYEVLDSTGASVLGMLDEAPTPSFGWGLDGIDTLQVTLPRVWGSVGAASEPNGGILANGNIVNVWVTDDWSLAAGGSRLIYTGTIEEWTPQNGDAGWSVQVSIVPLSRLLNQSYIASQAVSGDAISVAATLWNSYGGRLGWDAANTSATGVTLASQTLTQTTLGAALSALAGMMGSNYHLTVTPQGAIRFVDDTAPARTHTLTVGSEVTHAALTASTLARAKRVIVQYSDNSTTPATKATVTATAGDWDAADPRDYLTQLPETVPAANAQAYADALLYELNREVLHGSATVSTAIYNVDTISVGDRVQLVVPGTPPGDTGYGSQTLRIARISYAGDEVTLDFERPAADLVRGQSAHESRTAARFQQVFSGAA